MWKQLPPPGPGQLPGLPACCTLPASAAATLSALAGADEEMAVNPRLLLTCYACIQALRHLDNTDRDDDEQQLDAGGVYRLCGAVLQHAVMLDGLTMQQRGRVNQAQLAERVGTHDQHTAPASVHAHTTYNIYACIHIYMHG